MKFRLKLPEKIHDDLHYFFICDVKTEDSPTFEVVLSDINDTMVKDLLELNLIALPSLCA